MNVFAMFGLGVAAILGLGVASSAADTGMRIHAMLFAGAAVLAVFALISRIYGARPVAAAAPGGVDYNDGLIRAGVIASVFWGLAGFVAKLILPGNDPGGFIITGIIGIVGGIIGGFIGSLLGLGSVDGLNIGSIVLAVVGAMILLVVYRMMKKRA